MQSTFCTDQPLMSTIEPKTRLQKKRKAEEQSTRERVNKPKPTCLSLDETDHTPTPPVQSDHSPPTTTNTTTTCQTVFQTTYAERFGKANAWVPNLVIDIRPPDPPWAPPNTVSTDTHLPALLEFERECGIGLPHYLYIMIAQYAESFWRSFDRQLHIINAHALQQGPHRPCILPPPPTRDDSIRPLRLVWEIANGILNRIKACVAIEQRFADKGSSPRFERGNVFKHLFSCHSLSCTIPQTIIALWRTGLFVGTVRVCTERPGEGCNEVWENLRDDRFVIVERPTRMLLFKRNNTIVLQDVAANVSVPIHFSARMNATAKYLDDVLITVTASTSTDVATQIRFPPNIESCSKAHSRRFKTVRPVDSNYNMNDL